MTRESRFVLSFPKHIYWTVMFGVTVILIACVTFPVVVIVGVAVTVTLTFYPYDAYCYCYCCC